MNPLDIPEVQKFVVKYVDIESFKGLRLMNSGWKDETFRKWRSSAVLVINDETLPLLLKAFEKTELTWAGMSEQEKTKVDPFNLRTTPFKRYRFSQSQNWAYPLDKRDSRKNLIWDKVIAPNAVYLDVGDCKIKWAELIYYTKSYIQGLEWILGHCPIAKELAMAPMKCKEKVDVEELFIDTDDEEGFEKNETKSSGYVTMWMRIRQRNAQMKKCVREVPWSRKLFAARQLISLSLSSSMERSRDKEYKPLFKTSKMFFDCPVVELAKTLFMRTPNLKNLKLCFPTEGESYRVLHGLKAAKPLIQLECLTALGLEFTHQCFELFLAEYLKELKDYKPLQELRISSVSLHCSKKIQTFQDILNSVQEQLVRLTLEVHCREEVSLLKLTDLYLSPLFHLTHFKVDLDYETFFGKLLTFNLNDLRRMPKLQVFHFGTKNRVENDWVTRKLGFEDNTADGLAELKDLKSFHFHGNFTTQALEKLGEMMRNLETLEVVLDKENVFQVGKIWPSLYNLKLLPCSDVLDEVVPELRKSKPWNIVDESKNFVPAISCEALVFDIC